MSESNFNVIPAINTVDGFNPADFVRTTVGEEGENDLYPRLRNHATRPKPARPN